MASFVANLINCFKSRQTKFCAVLLSCFLLQLFSNFHISSWSSKGSLGVGWKGDFLADFVTGFEPEVSTNITDESNFEGTLNPPFQIIQCGTPRSASTFQHELLKAIVHVKQSVPVNFDSFIEITMKGWNFLRDEHTNHSFVAKIHDIVQNDFKKWIQDHNVSVFTSGDFENNHFCMERTSYHQSYANIKNCSLCEVDNYANIFGLDKENIDMIKKHMSLFEKVRKCCGMQMSAYRRFELHGCDTSRYEDQDPKCGDYNMTDIELMFMASPIPSHTDNPKWNWAKPGDCAMFDERIKNGKDFNNGGFTGCDSMLKEMIKGKYRGK
mmetsp:Transcript_37296/g.87002  ORF Transcript_37296/g.87002 Transcript_37296/m.87002 type:complete len:325 (-) Transcript_37296:106-1080(-)